MSDEVVFSNARIVGADATFDGCVTVRHAAIAGIDRGHRAARGVLDLGGDYLLPGLIELHTDNLEKHFSPRPGVDWPGIPAVINHDAQIAAAGITTVLDAVALGDVREGSTRITKLRDMVEAIENCQEQGLLRAEHLLHLRCEISFPKLQELIEPMIGIGLLKLVSIMDHTPGQRQFASLEKYREYYQGKFGFSDAELEAFTAKRREEQQRYAGPNRQAVVALCRRHGVPLASHDDATETHVREAIADGMAVAEFPTTLTAARASREGGMKVMMGGPNVVRGGSHSGNISAHKLAEDGLLDIVSSDYVPASLLQSIFKLHQEMPAISLPSAVGMGSRAPALAVGLADRGEIAIGKRADLIQVKLAGDVPVVRAVWRAGERVA